MNCRYCGKETNKEYCCFECRKAYLDYYDDEDKFKDRRKSLYIAALIVSIPMIVLFIGAGVTILLMLFGLITYTHPFPSQELKKKAVLKDAIRRVQTNGVIVFLAGIPFLILTYTPFF